MEREFWLQVIENNYRLPEGHLVSDLTIELLNYVTSPDPELRDKFAYGILARWIIVYRYHSPDDMRVMIEWLTPMLNQWIGEQDTDSVFGRSYAALILSLIVYRDVNLKFLEEAEVRTLLDKARHYLISERDVRAYVPEKGWANACGNTADLLKFLARNPHLQTPDLRRLLDTLADKLTMESGIVFIHDEDDRLAHVAVAVIRRDQLNMQELTEWMQRFTDWRTPIKQGDYDPIVHATHQNIRNFLRGLYYQLKQLPYLSVDIQDFETELLLAVKAYSV